MSREASAALALGLALGACAPPEGPSPLGVGPDGEGPPPVLAVGQIDPLDPSRVDAGSRAPPDLGCVGEPVIYTGGAVPVTVAVQEQWFGAPMPGWCVAIDQDGDPRGLDCDPARDPVSDAAGFAELAAVEPGPFWLQASSPPGTPTPTRTALALRLDEAAFGLFAPLYVVTDRVARGLVFGEDRPAPAPIRSLVVVVSDCAGRGIAGARVDLVGHELAPDYGDSFPRSPRRVRTGASGRAWFLELPPDDAVRVRVVGRLAADAPEAVIACASLAVPARTHVTAVVEPLRPGDPDCGGAP